jgi:hypothetical protein
MHPIDRFPRGQDVVSSARLVHCRQEAGGNRWGTSGKTIGHAPLTWAVAAAATRCVRHHPQGQQLRSRVEHTPGTGQALRLLAHTLGRAVDSRLTRPTAVALDRCRRSSGSSAGSLAPHWPRQGRSRHRARRMSDVAASLTAQAGRGPVSPRPGDGWDPRAGVDIGGVCSHTVGVGCPSPEPDTHWRARHAQPAFCRGRSEDTASWLGRSESPQRGSAIVT